MPKVPKARARNPNANAKSLRICEYCDKECRDSYGLKLHQRVHTGERPFPCNLCSYSATQKSNLKDHIRRHLQEKLYKCPEPLCNFSAVTKTSLNNHEVVHTREKLFSCSFSSCPFKTGHKSNLSTHLKTHEENRAKPFQCELCPFKATTLKNINSHMTYVHSSEKRFKCLEEGCGYAWKTKSHLNVHVKTHEEKRLSCPYPNCGYKTNLKRGFDQHVKIHSDNKRFTCRICDYASHCSSGLVRHMRTHTKERPYKCSVIGCEFSATEKSSLNSHLKAVHQKVRPFQCPFCTYASAKKGHLKRHQLVRHPNSNYSYSISGSTSK